MVVALAGPILVQKLGIQIPASYRMLALRERLHSSSAERNRREAWRTANALLRAAIRRVDAPVIDFDLDASERGHRIQENHRAMGLGQAGNLVHRLQHAGRGLSMHESDDFEGGGLQNTLHPLGVGGPPPFTLDERDFCLLPFRHLANAIPEIAVHANEHLVSRLQQIGDAKLHPRRTGSRRGVG